MTRLTFFHTLLRFICGPIVMLKFGLTGDDITLPDGPNLILANHVTNVDFMLVGVKTNCDHMHFVLAENIMQNPFVAWLINLVNDPIIHIKGSRSISTVKEMTKRLSVGHNVMIFPEGNTTFDGHTQAVDSSIGKMAKLSGANLVMLKLKGGYLTMPRWGEGSRKGRIVIESQYILAEDIKKMSPAEITEAINKNLYTDVYDEQKVERIRFKTKKPALGIERAMYRCPQCELVGTLSSNNHSVNCDCGYTEEMDEYGYLTDSEGNIHLISDYLKSQRDWLADTYVKYRAEADSQTNTRLQLFADRIQVYEVQKDSSREYLGDYSISTYCDYVECTKEDGADKDSIRIDFSDISSVTIFQKHTLNVVVSGRLLEIKGDFSFNALKYRDLYEIVQGERG